MRRVVSFADKPAQDPVKKKSVKRLVSERQRALPLTHPSARRVHASSVPIDLCCEQWATRFGCSRHCCQRCCCCSSASAVEPMRDESAPIERALSRATSSRQAAANRKELSCGWRLRAEVWRFVDEPSSSTPAFLGSWFMIMLIILSTGTFVLETVDAVREAIPDALAIIEMICIAAFTLEVVLRLATAPSYRLFFTDPFTYIDVLAILPFYAELAIPTASGASSLGVIRVVRLVRVARIIKVSRYSQSIRIFSAAMAASVRPLTMLVFLMSIAMIMFSSAMYYAELTGDECRTAGWIDVGGVTAAFGQYACLDGRAGWTRPYGNSTFVFRTPDGATLHVPCSCGDPNPFVSIPATFWWCVVTMTTVGYGDNYPVTPVGKIIAVFTMISGIIILALPITVIGTNFSKVLRDIQQERMLQELEELDKNQDGLVDEEELALMIQHMAAVAGDLPRELLPDAREIIAKYDTKGKGTLDAEDLGRLKAHVMQSLGVADDESSGAGAAAAVDESEGVTRETSIGKSTSDAERHPPKRDSPSPPSLSSSSPHVPFAAAQASSESKAVAETRKVVVRPRPSPLATVSSPADDEDGSVVTRVAEPTRAAAGPSLRAGSPSGPVDATEKSGTLVARHVSTPLYATLDLPHLTGSAAAVARRLDDIEDRVDSKLVVILDLLKRMNAAITSPAGTEGVF